MLRFHLIHTDEYLDLPIGFELPLNLSNPVFDAESIDRVWTLPFRINATANNKELLGHAHRVDYVSRNKRIAAIFFIDGVPFRKGILEIKKANSKSFELVFQSDTLSLKRQLNSLKLRELNIPIEVTNPFYTSLELIGSRLGQVVPTPYLTTTINGEFFSSLFEEPERLAADINAKFPNLLYLYSVTDEEVVYRFRQRHDLNQFEINSYHGLEPPQDGQWIYLNPLEEFDRSRSAQIVEDYRVYLQRLPEKFKLPTIYAPELFDGKNEEYAGYANVWDPEADQYLLENRPSFTNQEPSPGWRTSLLPQPNLTVILDAIAKAIGLDGVSGIVVNNEELRELLLWNNRPLDDVSKRYMPRFITVTGETFGDITEHLMYPGEWNLADYCPDVTALNLITSLIQSWAWVIDVHNNKLRFLSINNLLDVPPRDITSVIEPEGRLVIDPREGYLLTYSRDNEELSLFTQLNDVVEGKGELPYNASFFTLYERNYQVGFTYDAGNEELPVRTLKIPVTQEIGTSPYFELENDPNLKLLFWRGFRRDLVSSNTYPFASHANVELRGNKIGELSYDWEGESGRKRQFFERLIAIEQHNRTDERLATFGIDDLIELSDWTKSRVSYYTEEGSATAIISSAKITLRNVSPAVGVARLTLRVEP